MVSIAAVIGSRNEAGYLKYLLPRLAAQDIEVVILDNGSTDESRDLYRQYSGNPVIMVKQIPYHGSLSMMQLLEAKREIYQSIKHDWVMHHDSDEVFEHLDPKRTLRNAIEEADAAGNNILNFDEFVFLPEPGEDYTNRDFYREMLRYYFFEPMPNRKNAAWKRKLNFDNTGSGGHILAGKGISIFPQNLVYRHYVVLSYEHALAKYAGRKFSPEEIAKGWHGNRLDLNEQNLRIPADSQYLHRLKDYDSRPLRTDRPTKKHYWHWTE